MKFLQVLMLCLWLRSTSAEPLLPTCACIRTPTMLRSSFMQPADIVWPGKCFQMAAPYISQSRWSHLVKGGKKMFALTKTLEIRPCYDRVNDIYGGSCPSIISRQEWGARKPKERQRLSTPVKYAVVHHSETPQCSTKESCIKRIKSIQNYHMDERHYDDIGYNFLVGGDGNVYEGRGWDTVGAQVLHYNYVSIGICVIGNYMNVAPNNAALNSLEQMLDCLRVNNKVRDNYILRGHRDLNPTSCPGDKLYNIIRGWPHY